MGRTPKMSEGRKTQVVLLDDRQLEILIQPKLYAGELLDIVASHFNLKEKEYFGLSFKDETGHFHWLQLDRRVLEHDFPKKGGTLVLNFAVRFFIESIAYLRDNATIELFYLQAKQSIYKELFESDEDTAFELAAYVLQATYGDYIDDDTARKQLKKLPVLPTSVLRKHLSISFCENAVIGHYQKLAGHSRGSAIVNYMTIVESLPTWGVHYYEVKDKRGMPWWLGLSFKGISQYDYIDKKTPRKNFPWKQLENLYFRDKKFSIEVHDPKRVSVSRRTFGPGNVNVYAWFTSNQSLTKCIWSMAVSQHQFYLDRKQSKATLPAVRSMSELAADLCNSTSSLPSSASGDISRSNSAHSLTVLSSKTDPDISGTISADELDDSTTTAHQDMFVALKARQDVLEEVLKKKTEELRQLCLKEAELTGEIPMDFPLAPGEAVPQVRRRIGTEFTLSPQLINKATDEEEMLTKLELEFELQDKIVKAAQKLAQDTAVAKSVRKQRRQSYQKALQKLKDLEKKLNDVRGKMGKAPVKIQSSLEEVEFMSPINSPAVQRSHIAARRDNHTPPQHPAHLPPYHNHHHRQQAPPHGQVKIITSPKVEVVELESPASPAMRRVSSSPATSPMYHQHPHHLPVQQHQHHYHHSSPSSPQPPPRVSSAGSSPRATSPSPKPGTRGYAGYTPNALYQTRTQYRNQTYPTFSARTPSGSSSQSEYDNMYREHEAVHNMYNINTHQTMRYDSADELKDNESDDMAYTNESQRLHLPCKHGSLEGAYRRRSRDFEGQMNRAGSLGDDLMLPSLAPSKFGGKRESTADYRDSEHHTGSLPHPPRSRESDTDSVSHSSSSTQDFPPPPRELLMGEGNEDSGFASYEGNPGYHDQMWYEVGEPSGGLRQQPPPHTPQFESPPPTSITQDQLYQHDSRRQMKSPQQVMTVTKYQSYVEVSKPFEMSDFYKYSEKLRKQRNIQTTQEKLEAILSGKAVNNQENAGHQQAQPRYPYVTSPTGSRPESPYTPSPGHHHYQSASSSAVHARSPYQSGMVHSYQSQSVSYHSHGHGGNPMSATRHAAYTPLKPMTCEPIRDSPVPSSSSSSHSTSQQQPQRYFDNHLLTQKDLAAFEMGINLSDDYGDEMLAWYEDHDSQQTSTLV